MGGLVGARVWYGNTTHYVTDGRLISLGRNPHFFFGWLQLAKGKVLALAKAQA